MPIVAVLFTVAYALLIFTVTRILRDGTRQIETDYPLTEWPAPLGHDAAIETTETPPCQLLPPTINTQPRAPSMS